MAATFEFGNLVSDPISSSGDPLTLADAKSGAGTYSGIDAPARAHLVAEGTLGPGQTARFATLALAEGQTIRLDVDFTPGNLRLYVLDRDGNVVAQNDDSGVTDDGSPGMLDPFLEFVPPFSGIFVIVITSFDNSYLGNWQFDNAGTVTGGFQLDISAPRLPLRIVLDGGDNDFFAPSAAPYRVLALGGNDRVFFSSFDDVANGGGGDDLLDGGNGNDALSGGKGGDEIRGGGGNDVLIGGGGADTISGGEGNDEIHGGPGVDFLDGGNGNDRIFSGFGSLARGGGGDDVISGGGDMDGQAGNDILTGDHRANRLDGGDDNDVIFGGAGNDTIFGGNGNDDIDGGDGIDTVYFDEAGPGITLDLTGGTSAELGASLANGAAGGQGTDTIKGIERVVGTNAIDVMLGDSRANTFIGLGGIDQLVGHGGNDRLFGDDGNDRLFGESGNDWLEGNNDHDDLFGGRGNDRLIGGSGHDDLFGGKGKDTLTGGPGADYFRFTSVLDAGLPGGDLDVVTDFNQAQKDRIHLEEINADELASSDQAFQFIGILGFTGNAGELRYYFAEGGGTIVEGDINGDGNADFGIFLKGQIIFATEDFVL